MVWALALIMAHEKANTNEMLQIKGPCKSIGTNWCSLCLSSGLVGDCLFLHCFVSLRNGRGCFFSFSFRPPQRCAASMEACPFNYGLGNWMERNTSFFRTNVGLGRGDEICSFRPPRMRSLDVQLWVLYAWILKLFVWSYYQILYSSSSGKYGDE